ncbi:sigma-70 family RNA polymerase sigma factor [Pseudaquabacterium rugosum]|uniref:Sigma-70 family RNA polymerase sigma factor n=1 Tax=Pseudaquabacterium rugosum TaxID=2984194 RepID=A0ABU9BEG6_9BURK
MSAALSPREGLAAGLLYRDHQGWLLAWLRRRLGCGHRAADLAQDTWLRLIVSGRLPEPAQARAFLLQIARALVIDGHRRQVLEQAWLQHLAVQPEALALSAEQQAVLLQSLRLIDRALQALPPRCRDTFLLSRLEGLSYREIAGRQGCAPATVRADMLRALQACHAAFDGAAGGLPDGGTVGDAVGDTAGDAADDATGAVAP